MADHDTDVVLVLTTLGVADDTASFASALVDERLAACVSVQAPMTSVYRWQERVEQDDERQVVIKTTRAMLPQLEAKIRALHPYDLPELLVVDVAGGSEAYLRWVSRSTLVEP